MTLDRGEPGDETAIGSSVHAQGGEPVGHVKDMRGGWFKVNAPLQPDYWLSTDLVSSSADGRILLTVDMDGLHRYKRYDFGRGPTTADAAADRPPDYMPSTREQDAGPPPPDHVPGDPSRENQGPP